MKEIIIDNAKGKSMILLLFVYLGSFWSFLQYSVSGIFSCWDEVLAVYSLIVILMDVFFIRKGKLKINKGGSIGLYQCAFILVGLLSNLLYAYTSWSTALSDAFINTKFVLVLFGMMHILNTTNFNMCRKTIKLHITCIAYFFMGLFIADKIFHLYPVYERRFGIDSEQLFFAHPSFAAAAYCFLIAVFLVCQRNRMGLGEKIVISIFVFLTCMTQRYKAIGAVLLLFILFLLQKYKAIRKIKYLCICLGLMAAFFIAYDNIFILSVRIR